MATSTLRNLRSSYIPIELYKPTARSVGYQVPDSLNAYYNTIRQEILSYDYFVVTETQEGLPDLIAYTFYGDESLWWVICLFNGIIDPLNDLLTGMRIKIPSLQNIELFLSRKLNPSVGSQRKNTFITI